MSKGFSRGQVTFCSYEWGKENVPNKYLCWGIKCRSPIFRWCPKNLCLFEKRKWKIATREWKCVLKNTHFIYFILCGISSIQLEVNMASFKVVFWFGGGTNESEKCSLSNRSFIFHISVFSTCTCWTSALELASLPDSCVCSVLTLPVQFWSTLKSTSSTFIILCEGSRWTVSAVP